MERESMEFDVVIVGAGPAGLSTAIRLKQLAQEQNQEISVCILEKGSEVGAHILSGAVLEPTALNELFPDWQARQAPLNTPVATEKFMFLTEQKSYSVPSKLLPASLQNHGNYIISLGNFCRWLAEQAESLEIEIYPGFAAAEILYHPNGQVKGVATGAMGLAKDGSHTSNYEPGMELHAHYTVFSEGCRGHLGKELLEKFNLADTCEAQTYGIGLKELWEVPTEQHQPGLIVHSAGWPLTSDTYGGAFLYHLENNQIAVGYVIGLDYRNPHLSPFDEFQRFKTHPAIKPYFEGGRRISYGARALNEGGIQSLPQMAFPGGLIVGCDAGTLNMPKIKGTHTAMKSGMIAAEEIAKALTKNTETPVACLTNYHTSLRDSWLYQELYKARNIRPSFKWGLWCASLYTGIDQILFQGKAPWTLKHGHKDHETLLKADQAPKITYPKPDGILTFDKLSSVFISNTAHAEEQPVHLKLKDPERPVSVNLPEYDAPEQRYCPAGVYEIVNEQDQKPYLQINAQNCLHCKTCDIKDPGQNIQWVTPQGGEGPNYPNM